MKLNEIISILQENISTMLEDETLTEKEIKEIVNEINGYLQQFRKEK